MRVYGPAERLLALDGAVDDDTQGEDVVDTLEIDLLLLHLLVDREYRLGAALDVVLYAVGVEQAAHRAQKLLDEGQALGLAILKLGDYMVKTTSQTLGGVDYAILVVEAREEVGDIEAEIIKRFGQDGMRAILVINKVDTVRSANIARTIASYAAAFDFDAVVPMCAKSGKGKEILLDECRRYLSEGEWLFDEDMITDQPERAIAAEIIREKLLRELDEEIPHGTAVTIEEWKEKGGVVSIRAEIYCEKQSHKGIIIGKKGATIKTIGTHAREDIERMLDTKVFLDLYVRVKENWRDSGFNITDFGYRDDE